MNNQSLPLIDLRHYIFFKSNRWDILTNNNILIKLPLENSLVALNLAYKIIEDDQVDKKIIDLRVKDRLIIN